MCLFSMGILLSCRHRRDFENRVEVSLLYGKCALQESYYQRSLFHLRNLSAWEANMCMLLPNICSSYLLMNCPPRLWSPDPPLFLRSGEYRSLKCLAAFWISDFCRGPAWNQTCFSLGSLSHVNLIVRLVKELKREQGTIKPLLHVQLYVFLLFLSHPNPSPTTCLTSPKNAFWLCFKPQGCLTLSFASRA